MNKTVQDKEWNNLIPEIQEIERNMYLNMKQCSIKGYWDEFIQSKEEKYGIHNLYPKSMKILKIAATKIDGTIYRYEGDIYELMDDLTEKCYSDTDYIASNWWYLHGELEEEVGFDKGIFLNLESFETIIKNCYFNGNKEYFNVVCLKDGIYDVEILNIDKPCVGYFWIKDDKIPKLRGLVAFKDDKEAIDYITKKYNEKSEIL